jgi:hypothetical protein
MFARDSRTAHDHDEDAIFPMAIPVRSQLRALTASQMDQATQVGIVHRPAAHRLSWRLQGSHISPPSEALHPSVAKIIRLH